MEEVEKEAWKKWEVSKKLYLVKEEELQKEWSPE